MMKTWTALLCPDCAKLPIKLFPDLTVVPKSEREWVHTTEDPIRTHSK